MDLSNIELLLQQVSGISSKYDLINKKTGGYFNIFEIANIEYNEVIICRLLHELLSPDGNHFQGIKYLKIFFENVLDIDITDEELKTVKVFREYIIEDNRRIDLVIQSENYFIPIEVKIFAGEQESQCADYLKLARSSKLYYLTRFGDKPSSYSTNNLSVEEIEEKISCISFETDILNWLESCVSQADTIKIAAIREILFQFINVIRKFTNQVEDVKEMEILDVITKNPENMRNAIDIKNCVDKAGINLMKKIFQSVEQRLESKGIKKLYNKYDYADDDFKKCRDFYKYQKSSYPGISYLHKSSVKNDVDIWVRIEIDYAIFIGYCCPVNGEWEKQVLSADEIKKYTGHEAEIDNWWAYWEYLPNDDEAVCPDFKNADEPFLQLFDNDKCEKFIGVCVDKVVEFLEV